MLNVTFSTLKPLLDAFVSFRLFAQFIILDKACLETSKMIDTLKNEDNTKMFLIGTFYAYTTLETQLSFHSILFHFCKRITHCLISLMAKKKT